MIQITSRTIIAEDLPELTPEQEADLQRRVAEFQDKLFASVFPTPAPRFSAPPIPPCPHCRGRVILCFRCMAMVT